MALRKLDVPTLAYGPVSVYYDSEYQEYQVRYRGKPEATYFTDDRADALATAQQMRNNGGYAVAADTIAFNL